MFDIKRQESQLLVQVSGGLTAGIVAELRTSMLEALQTPTSLVQVDLTKSEIIDSKGLGLLIAIYNSISKSNGKLQVIISSPAHRKLFTSMRLDQHFDIINS